MGKARTSLQREASNCRRRDRLWEQGRDHTGTIDAQAIVIIGRAYEDATLAIPDYIFEQLHMNAATERVTKKYLVLRALSLAGYRIEKSDLDEDGRRNR